MKSRNRMILWGVGVLFIGVLLIVFTTYNQKSRPVVPPTPPEFFKLQAAMQNSVVTEGKADGTIQVILQLLQPTEKEIVLNASLSSDQIDPIEEKRLYQGMMDPMQSLQFSFPFEDLPIGKYKLYVQALSNFSDVQRWGGDHTYYFQVTDNNVVTGW
ncbi:hypothetical protein [Tumebacillus lipolyticus]|uniref:YtkA-like domain-containing protein n=1 Tax=Tumebacillus lipolyticus TaxID=1280370 RepID=A0ABW4ZUH0_9BACL